MLDSLKYVKKLEEAGGSRKLAEAQLETMTEIIGSHLATKQDMNEGFSKLETKVLLQMERMELRLTIRMALIVPGGIGALLGAVKLIHLFGVHFLEDAAS